MQSGRSLFLMVRGGDGWGNAPIVFATLPTPGSTYNTIASVLTSMIATNLFEGITDVVIKFVAPNVRRFSLDLASVSDSYARRNDRATGARRQSSGYLSTHR